MWFAFIAYWIYLNVIQTNFDLWSKHYEARSDCSQGSSLIWVHIVCNIGHQSVDQWAADNCCEQGEKS